MIPVRVTVSYSTVAALIRAANGVTAALTILSPEAAALLGLGRLSGLSDGSHRHPAHVIIRTADQATLLVVSARAASSIILGPIR